MIYLLAVFLGLIASFQGLVSAATNGNIIHLRNGRKANAGAALFPTIPIVPLLFVVFAWCLRTLIPNYATWVLIGSFLILSAFWVVSFIKLRSKFKEAEAMAAKKNDSQRLDEG